MKDRLIKQCSLWLLLSISLTAGSHFYGGSIIWAPVDPSTNATSLDIIITQTYSWGFPLILCTNDVPITSPGRSGQNDNLTCVVDCQTDGGYSLRPVSILTDCLSFSSPLGMMKSQKSTRVTLAANATFSVAYQGSAWRPLSSASSTVLYWSILSSIDLKKRPDGLINTPPVPSVVSPQYAIVNTPTQIRIPVFDVNQGDDVRCRWSVFQQGTRRRRQVEEEEEKDPQRPIVKDELLHQRVKRAMKPCSHLDCLISCKKDCDCNCTVCTNTNCRSGGNYKCQSNPFCAQLITTTGTTRITTTGVTTTAPATTSETPGTKPSTSSFPHRQAVDECGGICNPSGTPPGTTLVNCTLNFTGLVAGASYAVAIQIEDFINSSSNVPMSSVPVQFLIQVLPTPQCSLLPDFSLSSNCFEAQTGLAMNFTIQVINNCDPNDAIIADTIVLQSIPGMTATNLTQASDKSYAWVDYSWTPQSNQLGPQQFCVLAFTRSVSVCAVVILCYCSVT